MTDERPWWKKLFSWLKVRYCKHVWRPAVKDVREPKFASPVSSYPTGYRMTKRPARVCDECGTVEILTLPQFYARFGRMPW